MSMEAPDRQPGGDKDARTFGMLCHLLAFAGLVVPFGNIIGPLVMWLLKREEYPFVDEQGKEALNFQISAFLYAIVCGLLTLILIGIPLLIALGIFWLVVVIIASVKANAGESYRYPLNLRLIK